MEYAARPTATSGGQPTTPSTRERIPSRWSSTSHSSSPAQPAPSTVSVLGAGCAGLLLWLVLLQRDGIRSRVLGVVGWPPLVAVGLAAYSIYLIHDPVVAL